MKYPMHCLRCKSTTDTHSLTGGHTIHGRRMVKGGCVSCGARKSRFVREGDGIFDTIGGFTKTFDNFLPSLANKVVPGAGNAAQHVRGALFGNGVRKGKGFLDTLKNVGKVASLALPGGYFIRGAIGDGLKKKRGT